MNIISRRTLFEAGEIHTEARRFVADFYRVAHSMEWRSLRDVRMQYPSADLAGKVLIIDVLGNRFRLLFRTNFRYQALFFKGLFTHAEYDRLKLESLCPR